MAIKLEFNMPEEFFSDILEIARDYSDWIKTRNALRSGNSHYVVSIEVRPHWEEGKPFEEGDPRNDWQLVDHAKIEAAIQKITDDYTKAAINADKRLVNDQIAECVFDAVREMDSCHIDADAADAILQIAMFDELVFG